ncbi:DNA-methyltransferase [Acidovorax delafieldii]|uniref:DNA-methyltransferase n=1 Tax=Acidovorax delafieldii TaxID=47920 RepID=UPI003ECE7BA4
MSALPLMTEKVHRTGTQAAPGALIADLLCQTAGINHARQAIPTKLINQASERIAHQLRAVFDTGADWLPTIVQIINEKFDVNAQCVADFYREAAYRKVTFNYHQKLIIERGFNSSDASLIREVLGDKGLNKDLSDELLSVFAPVSSDVSLERLRSELRSPTITRKDSKPRDRSYEIMAALYSAFVYRAFPERDWHLSNDPLGRKQRYEPDFWKHLHRNFPNLFSRDRTLEVRKVSQKELDGDYSKLVNRIAAEIRLAFENIANHGTYAVLIPTDSTGDSGKQWQLFGDVVLFGEKHHTSELKQGYFRWQQIKVACDEHIPNIDGMAARFQELNFGFQYLDCFVIGDGPKQSILVLMQKHVADETLIPCPTCRSHDVQGNSYSSLGVKSWECNNQFCPDRSKFNRGKRYSFLQLLKQEAIAKDGNLVPADHVKAWVRDVQPARTVEEIIELLLRHFSLVGDTVYVRGFEGKEDIDILGRTVRHEIVPKKTVNEFDQFLKLPLFARYLVDRETPSNTKFHAERVGFAEAQHGDSFNVLASVEASTFEGAVTSPPYYNAREYSQWANIYTYLYDMYNIARQVYRVLKPGGVYLFNIFDYFDNENTISLSTMGDKRMILGPYMLDIFRRIGFECRGNIVWDKGDIEGKRGFNGGNFSPYYQAPFNCWEHILVLAKPGHEPLARDFPRVVRMQPVVKMVRGENRHGHTAPFPDGIPQLLVARLPQGAAVLDPFGGSMTTGRVANRAGLSSLCVERDPQYFDLGIEMLKNGLIRNTLL